MRKVSSNSRRFLRLAIAVSAALVASSTSAQSLDKNAAHQRMSDLVGEIAAARSSNEPARVAIAQTELDSISRSLGGDLPGASGASSASVPNAPAVAPPGPAGSTVSSATFTQNTPVAIADVAVVTSTVVVSGVGTYLWDADINTSLTHTFPGDMDITITSPAGTVVTLTTDNAGTNDNVFNGTLWDDQANPAGQVPYVNNNGLVTDQVYAVGVLASPLVPEEALAAFRGENPNGTWTITLSDDATGDTGTLASWSLVTHTLPSAPINAAPVTVAQAAPTAIADVAVVTSTIVGAGLGSTLTNLRVTTNITHTFPGDLDITLQGPAGQIVTLTSDNAGTNDNVFNGTLWDTDANPAGQVPYVSNNGMVTDQVYAVGVLASPLTPEESLGEFLGTDPNGTWTLTVSDDATGDTGSFTWSLEFTTGSSAAAPQFAYTPPAGGTVAFTGGAVGGTGTASIAVAVGTPGSGTGAPATTTTTCTAPTGAFSGFGQTVTAVGAGAVTGSPLSGSCTLGAAVQTQTLTCSENRGGTPTAVTFTLSCPAGSLAAVTSNPPSGTPIAFGTISVGGNATRTITFTNTAAVDQTLTCTLTGGPFSGATGTVTVPAGGSVTRTINFTSAVIGAFTGNLSCTAGASQFAFGITGQAIISLTNVPTLGDGGRWLAILLLLGFGLVAVAVRRN